MGNKTILILTNSFVGLKSFRIEVVEAIVNKGYKVVISAPFAEQAEVFKQLGCEIVDATFDRRGTNPIKDIKLLNYYKKLICQENPVAVLTYTIKPNIYGGLACQKAKVPQLANVTGLGDALETPGALQKLTLFLYKLGLKKTHTVFFQNKGNMDFCLAHGIVKDNGVLLPGSGVNLQWHMVQVYPNNEPIRFLYIGRLLKQKGVKELFDAAETIHQKYPQTEFHIVGEDEDDFSTRVNEMVDKGIVINHGFQNDVRSFIANCHCVVLPSYHEGMSNVLLEACAASRPVITTDVDGCKQAVEEGINGLLVKPKNALDLAEKLETFLQLPYEQKRQMGLEGRKIVEREFDRQIVVDAYLKALEKI